MSKPAVSEVSTLTATFRASIHEGRGQLEVFEDGAWRRLHFGPADDLNAIVDAICGANDLANAQGKAA